MNNNQRVCITHPLHVIGGVNTVDGTKYIIIGGVSSAYITKYIIIGGVDTMDITKIIHLL